MFDEPALDIREPWRCWDLCRCCLGLRLRMEALQTAIPGLRLDSRGGCSQGCVLGSGPIALPDSEAPER